MRISQGLVILLLVLGFIASQALFTVQQSHMGMLTRFGKFHTDKDGEPKLLGPGLHFKMPFIDKIHRFDTRLYVTDIESSRIVTSEKKEVMVDLYLQWRIENFKQFFNRTRGGHVEVASNLLRQKTFDSLRAEIGRRTIENVVSAERLELMEKILQDTDQSANNLGIQVVDVRVKRIDLPEQVRTTVFDRMRTERQRIASQLIAQGEAEANEIRAQAERNVRVQLATAKKQAEEIRGQGDAQATQIYASAYKKAPEFYAFYQSLESYKKAFKDKNDMLVLHPEGEFFEFFRGEKPIKR